MVGVFGEARTLKYGLGSRYSASSSALLEKVKSGMVIRRRMNFRRAAVVEEGLVGGRVGEGNTRHGQQLPEPRGVGVMGVLVGGS